ncbi:hypothetical protein EBZ70_11875 [bacterium]|nr:hypothetical protein [bacterium]
MASGLESIALDKREAGILKLKTLGVEPAARAAACAYSGVRECPAGAAQRPRDESDNSEAGPCWRMLGTCDAARPDSKLTRLPSRISRITCFHSGDPKANWGSELAAARFSFRIAFLNPSAEEAWPEETCPADWYTVLSAA